MMPQSNTLRLLMLNHSGTLHRALTLLRRLRYNVVSLHVEPSELQGCSEMIVVTETDISAVTMRRLERLIDVLDVRLLPDTHLRAIATGAHALDRNSPDTSSHFREQADGAHCNEAA